MARRWDWISLQKPDNTSFYKDRDNLFLINNRVIEVPFGDQLE